MNKKKKIKDAILVIDKEKTSGVFESLLSAMIFFSPNFLLLFPYFQDKFWLMLLYNYFIIFLLCSTIAHLRFKIT